MFRDNVTVLLTCVLKFVFEMNQFLNYFRVKCSSVTEGYVQYYSSVVYLSLFIE